MEDVLKLDDIRLHQKCIEVTNFNNDYKLIIKKMNELCSFTDAYGLAAPQLGIMQRFIFIKNEAETNIYFNPKIINMYGIQFYYESCMSIEDTIGLVRRPYLIELEAQDEFGNYIHKLLDGLDAIKVCHEIDHLDGILYVDRAIEVINNINYNERLKLRKNNPRKVIDKTTKFKYN